MVDINGREIHIGDIVIVADKDKIYKATVYNLIVDRFKRNIVLCSCKGAHAWHKMSSNVCIIEQE